MKHFDESFLQLGLSPIEMESLLLQPNVYICLAFQRKSIQLKITFLSHMSFPKAVLTIILLSSVAIIDCSQYGMNLLIDFSLFASY